MDWSPAVVALIAALLGGGGFVALYRARTDKRKTEAETERARVETQTTIVGEAVRTAQGYVEIATNLVKPLQDQIALGQTERVQLRTELSDQKAEQARLKERMTAIETLEAECREDRAALRRQLERNEGEWGNG